MVYTEQNGKHRECEKNMYETDADATETVNQRRSPCALESTAQSVGCLKGGDVPFMDESRTPSWMVRKSLQKTRA
jgi:hypothetical protein